ncbi:MAG: hypothetical protein Q7S40_33350 [Opitutaceae bacterium]|nr:hypothetical protein [Opitutaceae bacterium]
MKIQLLPAFALFATTICQAAPTEEVHAAARKLGDAPNYTWVTTTKMTAGGTEVSFGSGTTTGKTAKDGFTLLSRETQNGAMQTVRKGEQMAMQNPQSGEWMSMEEMRAQFANRGGGGGAAPGGAAGARGTSGRGSSGRGGTMFGGTSMTPADEITALIAGAKDLKAADGVIAGTLSPEAIAQRLSFSGRGGRSGGGEAPPAPKNASGSVKFWVKNGALVKYEYQVKGTVAGRDGEAREVERTSTTEIKDIGSTTIEVPEAAKKKLG